MRVLHYWLMRVFLLHDHLPSLDSLRGSRLEVLLVGRSPRAGGGGSQLLLRSQTSTERGGRTRETERPARAGLRADGGAD